MILAAIQQVNETEYFIAILSVNQTLTAIDPYIRRFTPAVLCHLRKQTT
jgi:hypothetical protein